MKVNWIRHIDATGYDLEIALPGDCIDDCSASGDVTQSVQFWIKRLGFDAPEHGTREYLKGFGAWDDEQLASHADNLERLLWSIACDEKEKYLPLVECYACGISIANGSTCETCMKLGN